MPGSFQFSVAPQQLWQAINPWTFTGGQFGLINIDLGQTDHPEVEQAVLKKVGSYGRQLGHMGEALEILLNHVPLENLSDAEKDVLAVFRGELAEIRQVKQGMLKTASQGTAAPGQ